MRGTVSPKLTPFLTQVNEAIATMKSQGVGYTTQATRDGLNNLAGLMVEGPKITSIVDMTLPNYEHQVGVRVYNPNPQTPLPVILHFHGGGHMCGSIELYDPISRALADACQAIVMCIDYRLAPEYPYPCGLNDCQYLLEHYSEMLDAHQFTQQLMIVGDSAGGAICTSLVMNNQCRDDITIDKQILMYPSVDYTMTLPSCQENGQGFLLEAQKIRWYFDEYFKGVGTCCEVIESASPLLGKFSNKMPQTLVITVGCDPLRDEGLAYVDKLKAHDVAVKHVYFYDMIHAYMLLNTLVETEYEKTIEEIAAFTSISLN